MAPPTMLNVDAVLASIALTPTERRLANVLLDGEAHPTQQLRGCVGDELAGKSTLTAHIHNLRKKLEYHGLDISYREHCGEVFYRLVCHVRSPY